VVGLIERRAEDRENGVADELVECPLVVEDDVGHPAEEAVEQVAIAAGSICSQSVVKPTMSQT
jgi:hypothetical protein